MKRAIVTIIGLTCCVGSVYAANPTPRVGLDSGSSWSLSKASPDQAFLTTASPSAMARAFPASSASSSRQDLGRLALKISYVGSLLLTADHIIRSFDSVLDGMEMNRADGTQLKLFMEPGSRGVDVMLKMSRPLDF